jgi:preprotein translocase subunit SecD
MKTVAKILQDADPLAYEPSRSVQERRMRRQMVLDAPHVREGMTERSHALAIMVALAIIGIALSSSYWSRTAVEAVAAVRFEVRLAEENPTPGLRAAVTLETGRQIYIDIDSQPVVANSDIVQAHVVQGDSASTFGVSLTFNAEGAARMLRATQSHIGRPLAILIDGEVVAAPVVRSPITTSAIISGNYARGEAERIVGGIVGR